MDPGTMRRGQIIYRFGEIYSFYFRPGSRPGKNNRFSEKGFHHTFLVPVYVIFEEEEVRFTLISVFHLNPNILLCRWPLRPIGPVGPVRGFLYCTYCIQYILLDFPLRCLPCDLIFYFSSTFSLAGNPKK